MSDQAKETPGVGHNRPPSITEELTEKHAPLITKFDELEEAGKKLPTTVTSDQHVQDITKHALELKALAADLESNRKLALGPINAVKDETHNFFKFIIVKLEDTVGDLRKRCGDYANEKARAERERLAEEAAAAERKEQERLKAAEEANDAGENLKADLALNEAANASSAAAQAASKAKAGAPTTAATVKTAGGGKAVSSNKWDFNIKDVREVDLDALRPFIKVEHIEAAIRAHVKLHKDRAPIKGVDIFQSASVSFRG